MTLILLGGWLAAVGCTDLMRATRDDIAMRGRLLSVGLGAALLGVGLVVLDAPLSGGLLLWLAWVGFLAVWVWASVSALRKHSAARLAAAFGALGGGAVLALLVPLVDGPVAWPAWLEGTVLAHWPVPDVVVACGVALSQLATANIVVRLVLDAVGVPATSNEKQLKGGRLLGPMERIFLLGLGVAGEITAAAVVVAAKGLLRFPEVQRGMRTESPDGPTDLTEYFLIGSFASWLWAMGGVALIWMV